MNTVSSTERFSSVVDDYVKYRPGYPPELITLLTQLEILKPSTVVADIGSGTGKSALPFLENKNIVYCVEPNQQMREAAESTLHHYTGFRSIEGTAENTTLPNEYIDLIVCAQAFHWFNNEQTRNEFRRILRTDGRVLLMWNVRNQDSSFLIEYEAFLKRNSMDYQNVNHRNINTEEIEAFFGEHAVEKHTLTYFQFFDFNGLCGRYSSGSYAYKKAHPLYLAAMHELKHLFDKHQNNGFVRMDYTTELYVGGMTQAAGK